jgi:N-acetyltransferase 10
MDSGLINIFQRMMALYVASHYKNSPNDMQLMADAPAHHLFVLLGMWTDPLAIIYVRYDTVIVPYLLVFLCLIGPVDESKNQLPDILCVIQVLIIL